MVLFRITISRQSCSYRRWILRAYFITGSLSSIWISFSDSSGKSGHRLADSALESGSCFGCALTSVHSYDIKTALMVIRDKMSWPSAESRRTQAINIIHTRLISYINHHGWAFPWQFWSSANEGVWYWLCLTVRKLSCNGMISLE